jgi:1,4-dihydroxy-2-naphthoate polyprenyltransferase
VLIVAVVVANQFPDYEADRAVGKNNLVVRLGTRRGAILYAALIGAWIVALFLAVWPGGAPVTVLAALSGLALALPATRVVLNHHDEPGKLGPACALTVALHAVSGIIMCAVLV